jgi:putative flippase GtrA
MKEKLKILLVDKTNILFLQFMRYTLVGGLAFLVDFGLYYVLTEYAGFHYILSATISFVAGLLVNYFISTCWIFGTSSFKKVIEFLLFSLTGIIGLGLNDLFIWFFTDKCRIHYLLSKLIAVVLVYSWNFLSRRYLIFNKKHIE